MQIEHLQCSRMLPRSRATLRLQVQHGAGRPWVLGQQSPGSACVLQHPIDRSRSRGAAPTRGVGPQGPAALTRRWGQREGHQKVRPPWWALCQGDCWRRAQSGTRAAAAARRVHGDLHCRGSVREPSAARCCSPLMSRLTRMLGAQKRCGTVGLEASSPARLFSLRVVPCLFRGCKWTHLLVAGQWPVQASPAARSQKHSRECGGGGLGAQAHWRIPANFGLIYTTSPTSRVHREAVRHMQRAPCYLLPGEPQGARRLPASPTLPPTLHLASAAPLS